MYADQPPRPDDNGQDNNGQGYPPPSYGGGNAAEGFDPRRILGLAITYRWLIIGLTATVTLIGFIYASLQTPMYMSQATVLVERGGAPVRELQDPGADWTQDETFFTSQLGVMKSRVVAEAALGKLPPALAAEFSGYSNPAGALGSFVSVSRRRESALFDFVGISTDAAAAADFANAYAEAYREQTVLLNTQFIADTNKLLMEQAKKLQGEYASMQQQYGALLTKTGSYYPKNQRAIVDSRIQSLEARKSEILIDKQAVDSQMSGLLQVQKGNLDPLAVAIVRQDDTIKGLVKQYEDGQKDLARMAAQFTPEYPPYKKKAEELDSIRGRIRTQALMLLQAQQGRSAALASELASLNQELGDLKGQAIQTAGGSSEAEVMGSGVDALQKYMTLMTDKMREMDITGKVLSSRVQVVNPALPASGPYRPRKVRTTALAFVMGLMLSGGLIAAVQVLDTRIKDPDAIERTVGVPVVGLIPLYTKDDQRLVVEAFQTLRTSLYYSSDHRKRNLILVTSPSSGEGKSSVVTNLGIIMAKAGEKVLVLDCDMRKSTLHRFLRLTPDKGLSDYLAAPDLSAREFILPTSNPNLFLFPAGPTPLNPPALFSMTKFRDLLAWVRSEYDWVLIDSPPCVAVTDGMLIAEHVDLILYVAALRVTHAPLLQRAVDMAYRLEKDVAGIVLNRFEWQSPHYYHQYYSKYYAKHHHYYGGAAKAPPSWRRRWPPARRLPTACRDEERTTPGARSFE